MFVDIIYLNWDMFESAKTLKLGEGTFVIILTNLSLQNLKLRNLDWGTLWLGGANRWVNVYISKLGLNC